MTNKTINEVMEEHKQDLMALPGVLAVALGLTRNRKESCIKVYLDREMDGTASLIPKQIDGCLVEIEIRGSFLPW